MSRLLFEDSLDPRVRAALGYCTAAEAIGDSAGTVVRDIPHRRTNRRELPSGVVVFRKWRSGRSQDAEAEWHWLAELTKLGLRVPQRAFLALDGDESVVGTLDVGGRSLREQFTEPASEVAGQVAVDQVAPLVARLHAAGLFYRDLYWNHLFWNPQHPAQAPAFIDVERVFRPRWRVRRWVIKDLAGLVSSLPPGHCQSRTQCLRFLRAYHGGTLGTWKPLARRILRKAERIQSHKPRWG